MAGVNSPPRVKQSADRGPWTPFYVMLLEDFERRLPPHAAGREPQGQSLPTTFR